MSDLTPQSIFGDILPTKLSSNDDAREINAVYVFDISGDDGGVWTVDLTKDADFVVEGAADESDCTIAMKDSDFVDLWNGKLKGPQAVMFGKLKIKGNMGLALKLQSFIG